MKTTTAFNDDRQQPKYGNRIDSDNGVKVDDQPVVALPTTTLGQQLAVENRVIF